MVRVLRVSRGSRDAFGFDEDIIGPTRPSDPHGRRARRAARERPVPL